MTRLRLLALVLLALVAFPSQSTAARAKHGLKAKHGVNAQVKHRTLTITGNRKANSVTLRRKGRALIVDVQSNGSADFKFKLRSFKRIAVNGGRGKDRLVLIGTSRNDSFALSRRGRRLQVPRAPGARPLSGRGVETVQVNALGGADTVAVGDLSRTGVRAVAAQLGSRTGADGAPDTLLLSATAADDSLSAGGGPARTTLGGLPWAVSVLNLDSADRIAVNGGAGADTLHVAGSVGDDTIGVSASGALARTVVNGLGIESDDVESLRVEPLAGSDAVTIDDLGGTDVGQVAADLGVAPGGLPDGQADSLTVNGRGDADTIAVSGGPAGVVVSGLAAGHSMLAPDPLDRLAVNSLGGADAVNASGLAPGTTALTLRGGADNDALTGSPGDDVFAWEPGDGVDTVEGGTGTDAASVAGSDGADNLTVAPNGGRVSVVGPGGVVVDMDDVEAANFSPRGGTDVVDVPTTMAGTDLTAVGADLGADGQLDDVRVQGTQAVDSIKVTPSGSGASVGGLELKTTVTTAEPDVDNLTLFALGEADIVDASTVPAGVIGITHAGGLGTDTFIGSQGKDRFIGGDGNDLALMGAGDDTFVWNPGDDNDTLEGQDGTDRLLFNGANVAENIDIAPNGGRLRFFRDIANVTMDADKVERVDFNAFGGADNVVVHDLTATGDTTQVNVNLGTAAGTGDAQVDNIFLHGTGGNDSITLGGGPSPVSATGLFTTLSVSNGESGDKLNVLAGAGDDTINAAGVADGSPLLVLQGDDNNDTITGSLHVDTLLGGNGDDTIFFTPGDTVDPGSGTNTVLPQ
ncbi:MAG TPA: hypothetical protein VI011_22810 [Asanoa sp.]